MQMDMRGRGTWGSLQTRISAVRSHKSIGDVLDGTRETLVALGVVVLETDLELDGLHEVAPLLAISVGQKFLDGAPHA